MNKQQLLSTLAGTVLTLGTITVAAAGTSPWQYDADSDTVIYAFSGPDHQYGDGDYPASRQTANLPWQYDEASDTVIYAFSGPDRVSFARFEEAAPSVATENKLPWYYYH